MPIPSAHPRAAAPGSRRHTLPCVHHLAVQRSSSGAATLPQLHHHVLRARWRGSSPLHMRRLCAMPSRVPCLPPGGFHCGHTWELRPAAAGNVRHRRRRTEQKRCRRVSKKKVIAALRCLRVLAPHHTSIPCLILLTPVHNKMLSTCSTHAPLPLFCQNLLHQLHRAQIQVNLVACTLATTAISGRRPTIIQRSDEPQ